jgi:hypothetical protein
MLLNSCVPRSDSYILPLLYSLGRVKPKQRTRKYDPANGEIGKLAIASTRMDEIKMRCLIHISYKIKRGVEVLVSKLKIPISTDPKLKIPAAACTHGLLQLAGPVTAWAVVA